MADPESGTKLQIVLIFERRGGGGCIHPLPPPYLPVRKDDPKCRIQTVLLRNTLTRIN